ncbi:hypothetical protein AAU57_09150 [Nonlabens sp. YIK11]|uniref:hypothetical protein n=1 Tax=Nonlabens sp. YIK11 TaxID=1453349 RepID=UPI0006DCB1F2|nr:hypothetical protein [Nonlabens sp. YIK11]KQC33461.1 hypothetical protein AAU57_09150 [Nonlabens sp. YIK11]
MSNNYRIEDGKLLIIDSYKKYVLYLNVGMVLIFLSSMDTVFGNAASNDDLIYGISMITAIVSFVLLILINYNKTIITEIFLTDIEPISRKKRIHNRKHFLKLKNGKERFVPELK